MIESCLIAVQSWLASGCFRVSVPVVALPGVMTGLGPRGVAGAGTEAGVPGLGEPLSAVRLSIWVVVKLLSTVSVRVKDLSTFITVTGSVSRLWSATLVTM